MNPTIVTAKRSKTDIVSLRLLVLCVAWIGLLSVIIPTDSQAGGDPLPAKQQLHLEFRYPNVTFLETGSTAFTFEPLLLERERPHDPWFGYDKALHFGISFLITVGTQYALVNKLSVAERSALPFSSGFALSMGLGKELYDLYHGPRHYFSGRDMVANIAGVLLAGGFILL